MMIPATPFPLPAPSNDVSIKVMDLTPTIARQMLARNTHPKQRTLINNSVMSWRERIQRREAPVTHQGIAFGVDGHLYDGQHRLTALADLPDTARFRTPVAFNLPSEAFKGIDQGRNRTIAHALGEEPELIAVARVFAMADQGGTRGLTAFVIEPYVHMLRPFFDRLVNFCPRKARYWNGAMPRAAAIAWMMAAPESEHYILTAYRALNTQDYTLMSEVVLAASKTENAGDMPRPNSLEAFYKITRVFDPANRMSKKLQAPKNPELYTDWVRELCRRHMPKAG